MGLSARPSLPSTSLSCSVDAPVHRKAEVQWERLTTRGAGSSVQSGHRAAAPAEETVGGGGWPRWKPEEWEYPPGLEFPWGSQGGGKSQSREPCVLETGMGKDCVDLGPGEGFSVTGV